MTKQQFIEAIAFYVQKYHKEFGINGNCLSAIISQAVLESAYGTSELAVNANNFFGLKYKSSVSGDNYYIKNATEQRKDGTYYNVNDTKWCKFNSIEEGVIGYYRFTSAARYSNLKQARTDREYLEFIKADGYATSLKYVDNLMNVINSNNLSQYNINKEATGMSNSNLVDYVKISPNKTSPRKDTIKKITIHHMAGNLTVEVCGNVFQPEKRQASANYGIGTDGRVGLYVEEKDRAWTSSSASNDNQAVTIEVANSGGAPEWPVSNSAFDKLIDLCVDICQRNGIDKLVWTGDEKGNLTCHYMFAATACPGPFLKARMSIIADLVNQRLKSTVATVTPPEPQVPQVQQPVIQQPVQKELYRVRKTWSDSNSQIGAYSVLINAKKKADLNPGYYVFNSKGEVVYPAVTASTTKKKSNEEVAAEVLKGLWGNGADRKKRLKDAGYNYSIIQGIVNRLSR